MAVWTTYDGHGQLLGESLHAAGTAYGGTKLLEWRPCALWTLRGFNRLTGIDKQTPQFRCQGGDAPSTRKADRSHARRALSRSRKPRVGRGRRRSAISVATKAGCWFSLYYGQLLLAANFTCCFSLVLSSVLSACACFFFIIFLGGEGDWRVCVQSWCFVPPLQQALSKALSKEATTPAPHQKENLAPGADAPSTRKADRSHDRRAPSRGRELSFGRRGAISAATKAGCWSSLYYGRAVVMGGQLYLLFFSCYF
jgi:hypothetical protein